MSNLWIHDSMRSSHGGGSDPWEFLELSRERWIGTPATSLARSWAEAFVCSQRGPQNVRSVDSVVVRLLRCFASQGFRWYKSTQLGPKPEQLQRVCQWRSWKFCAEETCIIYTTVKSEDTCSAARGMGSPHWGPKFKELIQQQPLTKNVDVLYFYLSGSKRYLILYIIMVSCC